MLDSGFSPSSFSWVVFQISWNSEIFFLLLVTKLKYHELMLIEEIERTNTLVLWSNLLYLIGYYLATSYEFLIVIIHFIYFVFSCSFFFFIINCRNCFVKNKALWFVRISNFPNFWFSLPMNELSLLHNKPFCLHFAD